MPALPADRGPHSFASTLSYLDAQAPELGDLVREVPIPDRARQSVVRFIAALLSSSELFGLARQQPQQVRRALEVLAASPHLAESLIHHPEDLAVLDSQPTCAPEISTQAQVPLEIGVQPASGAEPFAWVLGGGLEIREKMSLLRRHYRSQVLALASADLAGMNSVYVSLRRWSALAARSVSSALWIAAHALDSVSLVASAGAPLAATGVIPPGSLRASPAGLRRRHLSAADPAALSFVVLGLGRLGLNEFDLGSDADLVFVTASPPRDHDSAAGGEPAASDEIAFWTRLAEKTIEVLSSYTRDGSLFPVDTRLRPRGQEGDLVITEDGLLSYLRETAQAWEGLTYLKAWPVAGNMVLGTRMVERVLATILNRFRSHPDLEGDLQQMRRRLEREVAVTPSDPKTAPGGYYDIDFCVSYMRLRHGLDLPFGANILEQIAGLRSAGVIQAEDAQAMSEGAAFLRAVDHAIRLVTGKPAQGLPEHVGEAECVESLVRKWGLLGQPGSERGEESLARRLREVQQQVRYVYRRLVGSE